MIGIEAGLEAFRLLRAHRGRALLTMLGVVWGTASVIFLVGWGEGVAIMVERGLFKTGRDMGEVSAGRVGEDFTPAVDRRLLWFTTSDLEALRRRARLPVAIAGEAWDILPASHGPRAITLDVRGIEPEVASLRGVSVAVGRGIAHSDLEQRRRVVVLGHDARRRLLGSEGGVGSRIRIDGTTFTVVGVLAKVGTQLHRDRLEIDDHAWLPITTFQSSWPRSWTDDPVVSRILYRVPERRLLDATEEEIRSILAERLGTSASDEEAIRVSSSVKMLNRLPLAEVRGFLFVMSVSLLAIGGVSILNMMLESAHERRQEIGVRLAVGARRRDVVLQFFVETLVVTLLGGLAGVALGVGGCVLLGSLQVPDVIPVPQLSARIVALALAVVTCVGVGAGVVPAWRVSRVDPAETLRME